MLKKSEIGAVLRFFELGHNRQSIEQQPDPSAGLNWSVENLTFIRLLQYRRYWELLNAFNDIRLEQYLFRMLCIVKLFHPVAKLDPPTWCWWGARAWNDDHFLKILTNEVIMMVSCSWFNWCSSRSGQFYFWNFKLQTLNEIDSWEEANLTWTPFTWL